MKHLISNMKTYTTQEKFEMYLTYKKYPQSLPRKTNIELLRAGFPLSVQRKEAFCNLTNDERACIKKVDYIPEITEEELNHYESALRLLEVDNIDRL